MCVAYPRIGYDLLYFLPRLADTYLFQQRNGLALQWWTPTFGGGLPVFPNPQDLQLALPQFLCRFFDPFVAVCLTYAIVTLISCYALHRLARGVLGWEEGPACLLAVAASTGGYMTTRMAVGHVSYHAFALTPLLLLLAMDRRIPKRLGIPLAGLLGAYFVYSGGYFVTFAAPLALGMTIPIVRVLAPRARPLLQAISVLLGGAIVALVVVAAKLFAAFSYMQSFPRLQVADPLPSLFSPVWQLLATPLLSLFGIGGAPQELHRFLFAQWWGLWETDASLSIPIVLAAIAAIPILLLGVMVHGSARERSLAGLAFGVGMFTLILTSARGPIFEIVKQLPGLSNFRVTARFAGAFILPVGLIGAYTLAKAASRWPNANLRGAFVWTLVALALAQQAGYIALVDRYPKDTGVYWDAASFLESFDRIRIDPGAVPPIENLARVDDRVAVTSARSSLYVYEPLIGTFDGDYRNFLGRSPLTPGAAARVADGSFNMHWAPAFAYAHHYGKPAFTRIPESDRENLEIFLARGTPDWELPAAQRALNLVSLTAFLLTLVWLLSLLHPRMRPSGNERGGDAAVRPDCGPR